MGGGNDEGRKERMTGEKKREKKVGKWVWG